MVFFHVSTFILQLHSVIGTVVFSVHRKSTTRYAGEAEKLYLWIEKEYLQ